jgi:hypothetical protein
MDGRLPAPAEQYLRDLERALWPLGSDERETILLELRGHLAGCVEQGPDRLAEALRNLGTPEECSRAFVVEGAGERYRRAGLPGRALVPVGPPPEFVRRPESLGIRDIVAQVRATWRGSRSEFWAIGALLVTAFTATNVGVYMYELRPGIVAEVWPIMIVRLLVILAAMAAAYRAILTDDQRIWHLDLSSLRFAGGMLALAALAFVVLVPAKAALALLLPPDMFWVGRIVMMILLLAYSVACLRLQPWIAGLAIERRGVTIGRSLEGMDGKTMAILKGWLVFVFPLCLAHIVISAAALDAVAFRPYHLWLAALDAIASAGLAIGATLVNATAFRWVTGEPIPAPPSFNPEVPDERFILEARARLQRHIDANRGRYARP